MTRAECERQLIALTEIAFQIYHQYNPDGQKLSMLRQQNGCIDVSDLRVDPKTGKIACWTLEGVKYEDGRICSVDYDSMTIGREEEST